MSHITFILLIAWLCVLGTPGESAARDAAQGCVSSIAITSVIAHNGSGSPLFYVGDSINVRVKVTSACQIQSVVAEAFSATAPLSFNASQNAWNGTLSIAGKPYGAFALTATVTDINATAAGSSISLFHDTPPVVTVTLPTLSAVARPGLHVTAACVDDAGACASFTVRRADVTEILLSGSTHYDTDVSLSAYDGQEIPLDFKGTDSIGQPVTVTCVVYVESNPSLVEVAHSTEGRVLADSASYLLYVRGTDDSGIPVVRNKSTGVTTDLTNQLVDATVAFATDRGALAVHRTSTTPFAKLLEARDGVVSDLGGINGGTNLHASGNYAIWTSGPIYRRDIDAGSTLTVNTGAAGVGNTEDDVAANGDVVYWANNYQIYRVRDGVRTQLTSDGTVMNIYPVADGINVAYQTRAANPSDPQNPTYAVRLITAGGDLLLGAWTSEPTPRLDYAVNNGWTAFTRQVGASRNVATVAH